MTDEIGTVRREDHENGYSLWLLTQYGCDRAPTWRCVYSTALGNSGYQIWSTDEDGNRRIANTSIVGSLPGMNE